MMKSFAKIIGAVATFSAVSAVAHPGHEHHALQSNAHLIADGLMVAGAVVVAAYIVRALIRRNEG